MASARAGAGKKKKEANSTKTISNKETPNQSLMKLYLCGACEDAVEDEPKDESYRSIECFSCRTWFHRKCTSLSKQAFNYLEEGDRSILWICPKCHEKSGEEIRKLHYLEKRIDLLVEITSNLEKNIMAQVDSRIKQKIDESLDEKLQKVEQKIVSKIGNQEEKLEEKIRIQATEVLDEQKDKEERMNNIMVFNVEESPGDEENKDRDLEKINLIIRSIDENLPHVEKDNILRLGTKKRSQRNPRPIKVTFQNTKQKITNLKNSFKLKDFNDSENKRIGVSADLTKKEREQQQKLKNELAEARKEGGDYVIYDKKIMLREEKNALIETRQKRTSQQ